MDYITYLELRRDAWISMLERTEKGREYLENAWRLDQTEPEREKLRGKHNVKR